MMFRPPVNRAMRILDRSFFKKDVQLAAARVSDLKQLSRVRNELQKGNDLLAVRQITPIRADPTDVEQRRKCILLRPDIKHDDRRTWSEVIASLYEAGTLSLTPYVLSLDYTHWTASEILGAILPEELQDDLPTGFNPAGHVAHFNLREKYLPFKGLIGQVTLDKNAAIRTVINKTETLNSDNEYRVLDYEVIAGEPNLMVQVREASSTFRFDYSKVFWNSRLGTEHQRLVDKFQPGEVVCDVMAGVGPFAIPAGRKGAFVWANDLNPDCFNSLVDAVAINKVQELVRAVNEDGHSFIKSAAQDLLEREHNARIPMKISRTAAKEGQVPPKDRCKTIVAPKVFSHYVMNLPATAVDFLPDFVGLYFGHEAMFQPQGSHQLPLIHCYCFGPKSDDEQQDLVAAQKLVWDTVSSKLKCRIDPEAHDTYLHDVRDVAPNKRMFCATFRLPAEVAFARS